MSSPSDDQENLYSPPPDDPPKKEEPYFPDDDSDRRANPVARFIGGLFAMISGDTDDDEPKWWE